MNKHAHKVIFSQHLGQLVVVGEHAARTGKSATGERGAAAAGEQGSSAAGGFYLGALRSVFAAGLLCVGGLGVVGQAQALDPNALPTGAVVQAGTVNHSVDGSTMNIVQSTSRAVVNYDTFNIGRDAAVVHTGGVLLARVTGAGASHIHGQLTTSGMVLVNPSGVAIGSTANIHAGSFTASTLNVTDANFMAGRMVFERGSATGSVVNAGTIQQDDSLGTEGGGYVALVGASVTNSGTITTDGGDVIMAAADRLSIGAPTVGVPLSQRVRLELAPEALQSATVDNSGIIVTEGGHVLMRAAAIVDAVSQVAQARVTHSGRIDTRGTATQPQGGRVDILADYGTVRVSGNITANSADGSAGGSIFIGRDEATNVLAAVGNASGATLESRGGFVETSGKFLATYGTRVKAKDWLLDPFNITIAPGAATGTDYETWTPGADSTILASDIAANLNDGTNVTIATGLAGSPGTSDGNIVVDAAIVKSGTETATLTLIANNGIIVNQRIGRAAGDTDSTGQLNVNMTAHGGVVANGAQALANQANSFGIVLNNVIDANGGTVSLTGTTSSNNNGVLFNNNSGITAGSFTVTGNNTSTSGGTWPGTNGVRIQGNVNLTANTANGTSLIRGRTLNTNGHGTFVSNGTVLNVNAQNGGSITMDTAADSVVGMRVGFSGGVTVNTDGNVTLGSKNSDNSQLLFQAAANVNSGNLTLLGRSGAGTGVALIEGGGVGARIIVNNAATLTIDGESGSGSGVALGAGGAGTTIQSNTGAIHIFGKSNTNSGLYAQNNSIISSNAGADIRLEGEGLLGISLIGGMGISTTGQVELIGRSQTNVAVLTAATIVAGSVNIEGTSQTGGGVVVRGAVEATAGNVEIDGKATGAGQQGVVIQNSVKATNGDVTVTGETNGLQRAVVVTTNGTDLGRIEGQNVNINADTLFIITASDGVIAVGDGTNNGTVHIATTSSGGVINLGGADTVNSDPANRVLGLEPGELNRITAGKLVVGSNTAGNITVGAGVSTATATGDVELRTAGNIAVNNALTVGAAGSKNLTLNAVGANSTVTQTAAISAAGLELLGGNATHTLTNAGNTVTTLAANTRALSLTNNGNLAIGTVNSTAGITATGNVTLNAIGENRTVTQTAAISATGLELLGGNATHTLTNAGNSVTTLAANTQSLNYTNAGALAIDTVNTTAGVTTTAEATVTTQTGDITLNQAINGGAGNVSLNAAGAIVRAAEAATLSANNLFLKAGTTIGSSTSRVRTTVVNLSLDSAGDQFVTETDGVRVAAQTTGNGKIDIKTDNGTLTVGTVNGISGVTAVNGDIALEGNTAVGHGLDVGQKVETTGDVALRGTTTDGTASVMGGVLSSALVKGRNITMVATANSTNIDGTTLGYYGATGQFEASESLNLTGTSNNKGNGFYTFGGSLTAGNGIVIDGTSTKGQGVGFDQRGNNGALVLLSTTTGGILINGETSSANGVGIGLNGVNIVSDGGAIELNAKGRLSSTTQFTGGSNTITQNDNADVRLTADGGDLTAPVIVKNGTGAGDIQMMTESAHNVVVSAIRNSGTGRVVLAAGMNQPAGNSGGGQVIFSPAQLNNSLNNGTLHVYTGSFANFGSIHSLNPLTQGGNGFNQLFFNSANPSHLNNVGFNKAFSANHTALSNSAANQVVFRDSMSSGLPQFSLDAGQVSKIYGTNDLSASALKAQLQSNYTGPALLSAGLGANTFSLATQDVWDKFEVGPRGVGEDVGNYQYSIVGSGTGGSLSDVSASVVGPRLSITPRSLTVSASSLTREYDGTPNVLGTPTITDGSLASWDESGPQWSMSFDSANACAGGTTGCRTITPFNILIRDATSQRNTTGNYNITLASAIGTITPAALVIRANNDAKLTTTNDLAGYNGFSVIGLKGGDRPDVLAGLDTVTVQRSNSGVNAVGDYSDVLTTSGNVASSNYVISYESGDYTIVPFDQLLVRVKNIDTTYGERPGIEIPRYEIVSAQYISSSNPGVIVDVAFADGSGVTEFMGADGTQFVLAPQNATPSSANRTPVGSFEIGSTGTVTTSANYNDITFVGNQSVYRKRMEITLTSPSKIYDGTTSIQGAQAGTSNRFVEDKVFGLGVGSTSQVDVGENVAFSVSNIYLQGADANNYYLPGGSFSGNNGRIIPRELTVKLDDQQKVYGSWFDPQYLDQTSGIPTDQFVAEGLVPGEKIQHVLIGSPGFEFFADVGNYTLTGSDAVGVTGNAFKSSNYTINFVGAGGTGTTANVAVTPAPLFVVGEKVYDGTTAVQGTNLIAQGAGNQFFEVLGNGAVGNLASKNVQINSTLLNFDGLSLGQGSNGAVLSNYHPIELSQSNVDVTPRTVVVAGGITANDKVLTGSGDSPVAELVTNTAQLNGMVIGDELAIDGVKGTFTSLELGQNQQVDLSYQTAQLLGSDAQNYVLAQPVDGVGSPHQQVAFAAVVPENSPGPNPGPNPSPTLISNSLERAVVIDRRHLSGSVALKSRATVAIQGRPVTQPFGYESEGASNICEATEFKDVKICYQVSSN